MAYRAGVVGGSGYAGAELLRLLAAHPEIEVVQVTADSNAGAAVGDLYPSLWPAYERLRFAPLDAADLAGLDLLFCTMPHGASQALLPGLLDHVGHAIDLGADFRLPPDVYSRWYGEPHEAPGVAERFAYGLVELYRDEIAKHEHVASPGCYPTAVSLACAPLLALELVEPRVIADAVSGVSGAGRGLKTTSLFSEANENVSAYGLLTHRHTAEMEQALTKVAGEPVQVLFTPHLVPDDARHPRHLLRPPCHDRPVDRAAARALPRVLRRRSVCRGRRRAVGHEGDLRRERRARHRPLRRAHRDGRRDRGGGQPREGGVGPDDPGRQPPARPPGDHRAPAARDPAVSTTAAKGFVAGGLACGIKESGAPDLALVATDDHAPVPAAAVFTSNLAQAAPVQISRGHLADGRAAAVVLSSGNANAATGEPGRRDARRMCELAAARAADGHGRRARVLDRA